MKGSPLIMSMMMMVIIMEICGAWKNVGMTISCRCHANILPSNERQLNQTEDKSSHFSSFLNRLTVV